MLHGREAAEAAAETARTTFEERDTAADLPTVTLDGFDGEMGLLSVMVQAGLAGSNGEARRHVKGGAVKLNDVAVRDERMSVTRDAFVNDGAAKLSFGKKKHVLVRA